MTTAPAPRHRPARVSWLRPALALCAALLAGCAGQGGGEDRVEGAAVATVEAGTANFTIAQTVTGGPTGDQHVASEGALDFAGGRGRVVVSLEDMGLDGGGEIETVFEGETIYLRLPEEAGTPTPWVRLVVSDLEGLPGLDQLQDFSSDPSQSLGFLQGVNGEIEEVGEEVVRDAPTTRYRFIVDLEQAAEAADDEARAYLEQQIETLGVTEVPTEIWLDDEGRIARQSYVVDLSQGELPDAATEGGELTGEVATTVEYYDFGAEVDIATPAEDEVTEFADLLEAAGQD